MDSENIWKDYMEKEAMAKKRQAARAAKMSSRLNEHPLCTGFSTAYLWAKFATQAAADEFALAFPDWNVEVGEALVVSDED